MRASVLLTGFQTDPAALVASILLAATAAFYLYGVGRLGRRGRRWPWSRSLAFLAGLALVWAAVDSGVAAYDETSVPAHMVQHAVIMMIAPPLLVLGQPLVLAARSSPRPVQVRIAQAVRSRAAFVLTHPASAWLFYFGAMSVMFLDRGVYDYLVGHAGAHDASHVLLLVAGVLYWQPLLGIEPARRRLAFPVRMLGLMMAMPLEAFLGIWLRLSSSPIDPINTRADTHLAGTVFLVVATLSSSVWTVVVGAQWYRVLAREERRAGPEPGWAWSVPWWEAPADPGADELTAS